MTKAQLLEVMRSVLVEKMALPQLAGFSEDARLNEQLGLDSVLVLQLLVHLELDHGLALPEHALVQKHLGTIGSLAEFLLAQGQFTPPRAGVAGAA